MKNIFVLTALLLTFVVTVPAQAASTEFDKIVVFGDSLSDTGNMYESFNHIIPGGVYFQGRFSNGPVWSEYLVDHFKVSLEDYSYAAATTSANRFPVPSYLAQIEDYLMEQGNKADSKALHIAFVGNNNYINGAAKGEELSQLSIDIAVSEICEGVDQLVEAGAKNILVMNLPDLGKMPVGIRDDLLGDIPFSELATAASLRHNEALEHALNDLLDDYQAKNIDVNVHLVDLFKFINDTLDEIKQHPDSQIHLHVESGHQPNTTDSCFTGDFFGVEGELCDNPDEYFFWDLAHPTTQAYASLAMSIKTLLEEEYGYGAVEPGQGISAVERQALVKFNKMFHRF